MTIEANLILDSISKSGVRLCTWSLRYPRFIHPQLMTHRDFSRNAQSSRAMPTKKIIEMVDVDPVKPLEWGVNKRGMQADQSIDDQEVTTALTNSWLKARDSAINHICELDKIAGKKLHKQIVNRLLEPWMHITVIVSSVFHKNFFHLRLSKHAQPEIRLLAEKMFDLYNNSSPKVLDYGDWHLPYIRDQDKEEHGLHELRKISVARCARISYLTHEGVRDTSKDIDLHDRLRNDGHFSAFEHQATPTHDPSERHGNFLGWKQLRKTIPSECVREY